MRYGRRHATAGVNASSMTDIAFLLLTFFLITTQINNDRGISMLLPQFLKTPQTIEIRDRNVFNVQINSTNDFLIENEPRKSINGLRTELKEFILNNGRDINLSESPALAVVSLKTDRGTSYAAFIAALDEIQAAYFEIYASRVGITADAFRKLDPSVPHDEVLYQKGRSGIPMNISIAEPTSVLAGRPN